MQRFYKEVLLGFVVTSFCLLTSCSDSLELKPDSFWLVDDYYSSDKELELALNGVYSLLATDDTYGRSFMYMDYGTDEGYYTVTWNEAYAIPLYRHNSRDIYVKKLWLNLYNAINLSNAVIERTDEAKIDPVLYKQYIGEAYFLRGFCYYQLVAWYGQVPLRLLPTIGVDDNNKAKASFDDLYAQIIADFNFATENLGLASEVLPGRANKMAAHGLLARVYLKMAGAPYNQTQYYENAMEHSEIVINSGEHSLNTSSFEDVVDESGATIKTVVQNGYRNHFLNYIQNRYDTKESIFEISFADSRSLGVTTDGKVGVDNGLSFKYGAIGGGNPLTNNAVCASVKMQNLYDDDDIRKAWNIPEIQYTIEGKILRAFPLSTQYGIGKFKRWEGEIGTTELNEDGSDAYVLLEDSNLPDRNSTGINFPILRYSDVLLMYAEASNEFYGAPNSAAVGNLNEVRRRAGLPEFVLGESSIDTKEKFFNELKDERSRELCYEGLRKQDLIRWGLLDEALAEIDALIKGDVAYTRNPVQVAMLRASESFDISKHLELPYPQQEVQLNNKLDQKSEWE